MGYYSNKKIASVVEPNELILANNPNFVVFGSTGYDTGQKTWASIEIIESKDLSKDQLRLEITESTLSTESASFQGTYERNKVNNKTFYVAHEGEKLNNSQAALSKDEALATTASNLKECLMQNTFLKNNFEITTYDEQKEDGTVKRGAKIMLYAKGAGNQYNFSIKHTENAFVVSSVKNSDSSDSIDSGRGNYQIELDVYADHPVYPGNEDSLPHLGSYVTTLSKSYFGKPLWFDLSTLLSKKVSYLPDFLTEQELDKEDKNFKWWSDAGTMTPYRFIAKRTDGVICEPFYYSSPLYVLNGYDYTLNKVNLKKDEEGNSYVLDFSQDFYGPPFTKVKPLTSRFSRTHIKGQRHYFNYMHYYIAPTLRVTGDNMSPSVGLHYKIYTQSGALIGTYTGHELQTIHARKVNTSLLRLDQFLPLYNAKTVGRIDVYLCRWHKSEYLGKNDPEVIISTPLSFRILPEVINDVNDFAFLNRLGGWDSVNFGGSFSSEFKSAGSTIYKTLLPDFTTQSEIESVTGRSVQQQKTAQTSPISADVVEWLREMSGSPAVYELKTKRYIIIDDMVLKYNSTDDLYQVEMKYHYSDK